MSFSSYGPLGFRRLAAQARLNEFKVLQQQVRQLLARHDDGVRFERRVVAADVHLDIDLLLGLDEFVGLVKARVFDIVLPERNAGDAINADFHRD